MTGAVRLVLTLSSNSVTAVPAVHAMHPGRPGTVLGANAGGKIMRFGIVEGEEE